MTSIWHLVLTDVRRLRWPIAAWLLLVAGATIFEAVVPFLSRQTQRSFSESIGPTAFVLLVTLGLLSVLLIPLVVQADPPVGTDAFWMTRPIDPRAMWIAKMALLGGLVLAIPVLAQVVLMALNRIAPLEIARVAAESALMRVLWIGCFMALAALTQGMARFLLLCAAVGVGVAIVLNTAVAMTSRPVPTPFPPVPLEEHLYDPTSGLLTMAGVALAGLVLAALQYQTRRRSRSVPAGLLVLGLTAGAAQLSPWSPFEPRLTAPSWAMAPERMRLTADASTVAFEDGTFAEQEWRIGRARLSLGTMERGWSGSLALVDASLSLGQTVLQSPGTFVGQAAHEGRPDGPLVVLRDLLGVRWIGIASESGLPAAPPASVMIIRTDDFQRHAAARGAYRGRFRVDLREETIGAVLPLTPGASYQDGVNRLVIEAVTRSSSGVGVTFRELNATSVFDATVRVTEDFFLRNVAQAEAIQGTYYYSNDPSPVVVLNSAFFLSSEASGLRNRLFTIDFPASIDNTELKWSRDPDWFADVELVIVRTRSAGSVVRTLDIADFPLRGGR